MSRCNNCDSTRCPWVNSEFACEHIEELRSELAKRDAVVEAAKEYVATVDEHKDSWSHEGVVAYYEAALAIRAALDALEGGG